MTETFDVLTMGRSCIDLYAHQIGVPITQVTSSLADDPTWGG